MTFTKKLCQFVLLANKTELRIGLENGQRRPIETVSVILTWATIKKVLVGTDRVTLTAVLTGILVRFVDSLFDLKKKFIRHSFKKSTRSDSMTPEGGGGLKRIDINTIHSTLVPLENGVSVNLRHMALSLEVGLEEMYLNHAVSLTFRLILKIKYLSALQTAQNMTGHSRVYYAHKSQLFSMVESIWDCY